MLSSFEKRPYGSIKPIPFSDDCKNRTQYPKDSPTQKYIHNDTSNKQALEKLYTNAMKIESLIEVIQFMNKVQNIE